MIGNVAFWPPAASANAAVVDQVFFIVAGVCAAIFLVLAVLLVTFLVRYRASRPAPRGRRTSQLVDREIELGWTLTPLLFFLFVFVWATATGIGGTAAPKDAIEVHVVAKQWMWKSEHPGGQREINELHVPVGQAVSLTLASKDVIHSFYVPAFRLKQDAVPGRLTTMWFNATLAGEYPLFCAEYCGLDHSRMGGRVVVMEPQDYADWLAAQPLGQGPVQEGRRLFAGLGCAACHENGRAPDLAGLFGSTRQGADGATQVGRQQIEAAIMHPAAERDANSPWPLMMPNYADQIDGEDLLNLVSYVQSLVPGAEGAAP